ncbi:centrosome-associated protein 350-like [Haliotis cracherodii]|uniref:centrosome-associated protein 350-like n=1 Tax=Haliotis cracherodii TaxID=6455 RepID=UPI0039E8406B
MLPGKRVTDPVPIVTRQHGGAQPKDLNWAWDTIGKVRSEIRRMEHRLDDPDRHLPPPTSDLRPVVDLGRELDQTYTVRDQVAAAAAAKASCDRYDYTAYQRSKTAPSGGHRKVSRIDEKYHEEGDLQVRVGSRKADRESRSRARDGYRQDYYGSRDVRMGSPKRVDFSHNLHLREVNTDGTYLDSVAHQESSTASSTQSLDVQSTLTDSRAIRETELRFLNDHIPSSRNYQDVRWDGTRLTRVNVQVPTGTMRNGRTRTENLPNNFGSEHSEGGLDRRREDYGKQKRVKKSLKDLPDNNELFEKIREKIRQQRLTASSSDTSQDSIVAAPGGLTETADNPLHVLHGISDAVQTTAAEDGVGNRQPRVRKVAAGPPLPVYKGFTEVHTDPRFQMVVRSKSPVPRKKPKTTVGKLQRKVSADPHNDGGSSSEKPKRLRVVAPEKETSQPGAKGIITTSSWRVGQQLILQTLGPAKTSKKSSQGKKSDNLNLTDENKNEDVRRPDGAETHNLFSSGNREGAVGGNSISRTTKSLPDDARRILDDLQLEDDDGEGEHTRRRRLAVKRKALKHSEPDKQQPAASKQRHYDQSKVRKFIAKQKAERVRQKKEEERAHRAEQEKRQRHLAELYNKQKPKDQPPQPQPRAKTRGRRSGGEEDPQRRDHRALGLSLDSDKENAGSGAGMEVDDDDSTLTEGTEEDVTPTGTPRDRRDPDVPAPHQLHLAPPAPLTVGGQKLNLDVAAVLSKFSEVVNRKKDLGGATYQQPILEHSHRTQADRIRAVKETSATLQNKLVVSRNIMEAANRGLEVNAMPRYDRIIGAHDDYQVFDRNLPGSVNSRLVLGERDENEAATRIQAAYRGHTVRQSMNWPLPSGQTLGARFRTGEMIGDIDALEESSITETSTFSDITITEDSENESMNSRPGQMLKHVRGGASDHHLRTTVFKPTSKYVWEEPRGDPLSIINVYQRKMKSMGRENDRLAPAPSLPRDSAMNSQEARQLANQGTIPQTLSNQGTASRISNQQSASRSSISQQPASRLTESASVVSEPMGLTSARGEMHTQPKSRDPVRVPDRQSSARGDDVSRRSQPVETSVADNQRSRRDPASFRPVRGSITDESCIQSFSEEDEDRTPTASRPNSRPGLSHNSVKVSEVTGQDSDASLVSDEEMLRSRLSRHELPLPGAESREPGRFSPNTLEQKMYAELNRLESMEVTLHQLTSVDRTRAVSLAQQETVSLAQILKARQQTHEHDMRQLKLQAQKEAFEANQQLEETQRQSATGGGVPPRLSREEIQTLKKEAIRAAAEAWNLGPSDNNRRPGRKDKSSSRDTASRSRGQSQRSDTDVTDSLSRKPRKPTSVSYSVSKSYVRPSRSAVSESVRTAKDSQQDTDSDSIRTASDAEGRDTSKTRSIKEDIRDEDYTMSFDESMTEDESFRQVLPSESHRKEVKRRHGDSSALAAADETGTNSRLAIGDLTSLFVGEDNFSKFTAEMVRQIMREEELRAQHQAALLRLREKALKEKTKAELAWIKQQKQLRHRGHDDKYPEIHKQEQSILRRQKEQQEEIRRLQEANKLASRERQCLLQQHEEIAKMRQSTKKTLGHLRPKGRLHRPVEVHTEDEVSALDDVSDVSEDMSQLKDYKSDSEVYGKDTKTRRRAKGDKQKIDKQMKNRLDQKYLTSREQKLHNRRRNAEELLAWKQRLDEEEQEVFTLEKQALSVWGDERGPQGGAAGKQDRPPSRRGRPRSSQQDDTTLKKVVSKDAGAAHRDETTISEQLTTARDESGSRARGTSFTQKSDAISTQISATRTERSEKRSRGERSRSPAASGSEGSIPEEIPARSDEGSTSSPEKNDDTIVNSSAVDDYNNDTFEQDTTVTSRKKSPVGRFLPQGSSPLPSPWSRKGGSESESEDSISHTETLSDASDYEVRIRQLSDELRRRRREVEILKKDRKKKAKERMRAQEDSLKKQIEAYDNYITQLRHDQIDLEHDAVKATVKPQIKQPKVTTGKSPGKGRQQDVSPSKRTPDAEHNHSSSFEDTRDGTESSHTSPSLSDSRDLKLSPVQEDKSGKKKSPFLDRISEGSESDKSGASGKKAEPGRRDKSESSVSEVIEELSNVEDSVVSERTVSGMFKVKTDLPALADSQSKQSLHDDDPSYSMTFTDAVSVSQDNAKLPLSVHSRQDVPDQSVVTRDRSEVSVSEQLEEALSLRSEQTTSVPLRIDLNKDSSVKEGNKASQKSYTTGIPESDSENETKSHHTLSYSTTKSEGTASRPSSEKSVASTNYSQDFEEEDLSESERTPVAAPAAALPSIRSGGGRTEEEVSEVISASLPSISEKKAYNRQDTWDNALLADVLGGLDDLEDDEDKTPTETPREASPPPIGQEENSALLMTDPLADFNLADKVLVWGRKKGTLLYKGKVDFAPGIWAGVELDKPEGDMDGTSGGREYFSCRPQYGVLVHGSDISPQMEMEENLMNDVKSPDDSVTDVSAATETELEKEILTAAENVESFVTTPPQSPSSKKSCDINSLADDITDHITMSIVKDSMETMGNIAAKQAAPGKKVPPATLPKPKLQQQTVTAVIEKVPDQTTETTKSSSPKNVSADKATNSVMDSMLNEAISQMVSIRNKQRSRTDVGKDAPSGQINGHLSSDELDSLSAGGLLNGGREQKPDILVLDDGADLIQRPESPMPGEHGLEDLDQDISGLLGMEENEYFDDDMGLVKMGKPPPPYPGGPDQGRGGEAAAAPPVPEEVVFAVPHQQDEVESIVASAIDVYWNCRRCGEPMDNVEPPEEYFKSAENGRDMASHSRRVFKQLLFDLTGEIIREIYKDEHEADPLAWQKPRKKQTKYYKGLSPPTTVDHLRPIVQSAVSEIMGINGTRNSDRAVNKWNIRKKRDHVDNVLVQELRAEEPNWVNYDADEMSVKNHLTDVIMEALLTDTVHTLNKIFQKRHYRSQQS